MSGNSIGKLFSVTTFGESHGAAVGAVIDGCPAGLSIDESVIQKDLDRRKPGQSHITTQRKESDTVKILSGIFEGKTLGTPIALLITNNDQQPGDYESMKDTFRPSHADYTYFQKYGIRDYRGGGRSSARATAAAVAAGAIARQLLQQHDVQIAAYVTQIGEQKAIIKTPVSVEEMKQLQLNTEASIVRCPDKPGAEKMIALIEKVKSEGDSLGGIISCVIKNCPAGLGEPLFDKLQAEMAKAMFSINAVHGFEYGSGFEGAKLRGSQHNDAFEINNERVVTASNHSGGIQGGISNGMDIYFNVAFKPTSTISKEQHTINKKGESVTLAAKGRHDPCVLPRAVPIVEAMAAIVLADHLLRNRSSKV